MSRFCVSIRDQTSFDSSRAVRVLRARESCLSHPNNASNGIIITLCFSPIVPIERYASAFFPRRDAEIIIDYRWRLLMLMTTIFNLLKGRNHIAQEGNSFFFSLFPARPSHQ